MSARKLADLVLESIQEDVRIVDRSSGDDSLADVLVRGRNGRPVYRITVCRLDPAAAFGDVSLDMV